MEDKATTATPGRVARAAGSGWGRQDLVRRVARLPIAAESRARVARFVEDEIARARTEWLREATPLDGLACPKCSASIGDELRRARRDDELVAAVRALGLDKLSPDELDSALGKKKGD